MAGSSLTRPLETLTLPGGGTRVIGKRRLAGIMSADAQGYSRLMGEDEVGTVRTLTSHRAAMRDVIMRHRGRVVDSPGDNLLAEFASVADAVECAVEIQRSLRERNSQLPERRRLEFRIGVNVGDVLVEDDRIYGDAVNIAARLQSLAEPGGIAISGTAYDQVETKLRYHYEPLGEHIVKNIAKPVRVYRLVPTEGPSDASDVPRRLRRETSPAPRLASRPAPRAHRPSIAVLPFREYDIQAGGSYFADGIVEDIVGALASLPDLFVISRCSTLGFRGPTADVRSVGRKLNVQYVLSGSVRRRAERIRTVAELCETEAGAVLWNDSLDGTVDDVFALQDRLSERIVTTIAPHVRQAELRRALRKRPDSMDAYDFVLRGLDLMYRLRRDEFERAREMFQRAIDLDPAYATPYALTANWYSIRVGQGWSEDLVRDFEEVTRLGTAALERDPFDARALALCGHVRAFLFRDYEPAFALFDRAIAASPNSSEAWLWSSPAYSYVGDGVEARRRAQEAIRLSPFDPHLFIRQSALALALYTTGDFEEAANWARRAMSENPRYTALLRIFIASLVGAGRVDEARTVAQLLLEQEPTFRVASFCRNYAYKDPARRDLLASHLRSAGLPD
jgi:adenylate cyclase